MICRLQIAMEQVHDVHVSYDTKTRMKELKGACHGLCAEPTLGELNNVHDLGQNMEEMQDVGRKKGNICKVIYRWLNLMKMITSNWLWKLHRK